MTGIDDADELTSSVLASIEDSLEPGYPWPGNFRELEQCVWNILIRNEYHPTASPAHDAAAAGTIDHILPDLARLKVSADDLLNAYCTFVYARLGSYEESAKLLKLDRRTVRKRVDPSLLLNQSAADNPPTM